MIGRAIPRSPVNEVTYNDLSERADFFTNPSPSQVVCFGYGNTVLVAGKQSSLPFLIWK
jgi:hypothetical protein